VPWYRINRNIRKETLQTERILKYKAQTELRGKKGRGGDERNGRREDKMNNEGKVTDIERSKHK
jgi:hypothetical protein